MAPLNCYANELFKIKSILKFNGIINIEKLKIAFDFNKLSHDLMNLFAPCETIHKHSRYVVRKGCFVPSINTSPPWD